MYSFVCWHVGFLMMCGGAVPTLPAVETTAVVAKYCAQHVWRGYLSTTTTGPQIISLKAGSRVTLTQYNPGQSVTTTFPLVSRGALYRAYDQSNAQVGRAFLRGGAC